MKEIGRLAGVSQTAVSFILNGKADKLSLSPKTVHLVEQIAREHNYSPNILARGMKNRRTGVVGILLFDRSFRQIADGENHINVFMRLHAKLLLHGHCVIMEPVSWQDVEEQRFPASVTSGLMDTVLLAFDDLPTEKNDGTAENARHYIERLQSYCRCCFCFPQCYNSPPDNLKYDIHAGELAADDLWRRGARTFAILGRTVCSPSHSARVNGFKDRIAALAGTETDIPYYGTEDCWVPECGRHMAAAMLDSGKAVPDGVFALADYFISGAVEEMRSRGIDDRSIAFAAIGDSVRQVNCSYPMSYVGFDDSHLLEQLFKLLTDKHPHTPPPHRHLLRSEPLLTPYAS
ncbi:MAG: LacI family DNA-binding transcriptional regulator [Victivallales bacterium]|nr:LacI family DNA-binding transcriptional regulator [Victivallales bacterium]